MNDIEVISLRVDESVIDLLNSEAKKRNLSRTELINTIIADAVEKDMIERENYFLESTLSKYIEDSLDSVLKEIKTKQNEISTRLMMIHVKIMDEITEEHLYDVARKLVDLEKRRIETPITIAEFLNE